MKDYYPQLAYSSKSSANRDGDAFRLEVHATLMGHTLHDGSEAVLGYGRVSRLQVVRAYNEGRLTSLFDANQELCIFAEAVMTPEWDELKLPIARQFEMEYNRTSDITLIHEIYLRPEIRGQGMGLFMVSAMMSDFGPTEGLIVLEPAPFRNEPHPKLLSEAKARAALGKHWAKLGFKKMEKVNYWGFNPAFTSPEIKLPRFCRADLKNDKMDMPQMMRERRVMFGIALT